MYVCVSGALVAILTLALTGSARAEDSPSAETAVLPAPEAPPIPEAPPALEATPAAPPAPVTPIAAPDWDCVPYDAAPCGDGFRVCAGDGSGWGACLAGDAPALASSQAIDRRDQPQPVASWQRWSPGLRTLGVVVEVAGLLVATIGVAQFAGVMGKNDSPGPTTLVAAGGGAFASGLVIQYVGSIYTPVLDPDDEKGAPALRLIEPRIAPYLGLAGAGVHGCF
jgi:hypothetical protein